MQLSEKLILLRKRSGMSQEDLAYEMGVSRQAVSKWESGQSMPDIDKLLLLSRLYNVTTDYLLKDEQVEEDSVCPVEQESLRRVTMEQAEEYLALSRAAAWRIALGVALCVWSVIPLILGAGLAEFGVLPMSEDLAVGLGLILLMLILIPAVALFIISGVRRRDYVFLEKEPFETERGVDAMIRREREEFRGSELRAKVTGVSFLLLSAVAVFIAQALGDDRLGIIMAAVMLAMIGMGAGILVRVGVRDASMERLLREGDYAPENRRRLIVTVAPIYWLVTTAIYLCWLFFGDGNGNMSWVIWPVAGVLFAAVTVICGAIDERRKNKAGQQ